MKVQICPGCGKEIQWIRMAESGKAMPCETKLFRIVTRDGRVVSGWESHYAHCPKATTFRKERKKGATKQKT